MKYICNKPLIDRSGKHYKKDDPIELDEVSAQFFINKNLIREDKAPQKKDKEEPKKETKKKGKK